MVYFLANWRDQAKSTASAFASDAKPRPRQGCHAKGTFGAPLALHSFSE